MWDRSPAPATTNAPPCDPSAQSSRETCGGFQSQSSCQSECQCRSVNERSILNETTEGTAKRRGKRFRILCDSLCPLCLISLAVLRPQVCLACFVVPPPLV